MRVLTPLSINEILLPRYRNWSIDFKDLPSNKEIDPHMNSVLSEFV